MKQGIAADRGFTISEVVVVVLLLGVLALVGTPVFVGVRRASLENAATQSARLINAARDSYALTIPAAHANWAASAGDEARLLLLIQEEFLAGSAAEYLTMDGGYSVSLDGGLRSRTVLKLDGQPIPY